MTEPIFYTETERADYLKAERDQLRKELERRTMKTREARVLKLEAERDRLREQKEWLEAAFVTALIVTGRSRESAQEFVASVARGPQARGE